MKPSRILVMMMTTHMIAIHDSCVSPFYISTHTHTKQEKPLKFGDIKSVKWVSLAICSIKILYCMLIIELDNFMIFHNFQPIILRNYCIAFRFVMTFICIHALYNVPSINPYILYYIFTYLHIYMLPMHCRALVYCSETNENLSILIQIFPFSSRLI